MGIGRSLTTLDGELYHTIFLSGDSAVRDFLELTMVIQPELRLLGII